MRLRALDPPVYLVSGATAPPGPPGSSRSSSHPLSCSPPGVFCQPVSLPSHAPGADERRNQCWVLLGAAGRSAPPWRSRRGAAQPTCGFGGVRGLAAVPRRPPLRRRIAQGGQAAQPEDKERGVRWMEQPHGTARTPGPVPFSAITNARRWKASAAGTHPSPWPQENVSPSPAPPPGSGMLKVSGGKRRRTDQEEGHATQPLTGPQNHLPKPPPRVLRSLRGFSSCLAQPRRLGRRLHESSRPWEGAGTGGRRLRGCGKPGERASSPWERTAPPVLHLL